MKFTIDEARMLGNQLLELAAIAEASGRDSIELGAAQLQQMDDSARTELQAVINEKRSKQ